LFYKTGPRLRVKIAEKINTSYNLLGLWAGMVKVFFYEAKYAKSFVLEN
jgi:hypothetical protein